MSKVQHPTKHYLVHVVKEYGKDFELLFVYLLLNYCYIHLNTMPISQFHLGFWLRLRLPILGFGQNYCFLFVGFMVMDLSD